ncbi:MAG: amidohydrolase family protein, partial [Dehalococcoidia bacterium]
MKYPTVVKGGTIVSASDSVLADVAIRDGKIAAIGIDLEGDEIIDAKGHYVIPGGIDVHTHLDMPFGGTTTADDFETGTRAAACGGTTTIIDFAIQQKGEALRHGL